MQNRGGVKEILMLVQQLLPHPMGRMRRGVVTMVAGGAGSGVSRAAAVATERGAGSCCCHYRISVALQPRLLCPHATRELPRRSCFAPCGLVSRGRAAGGRRRPAAAARGVHKR